MKRMRTPRRSITTRLMCLIALLLVVFTLLVGVLYNALMQRQLVMHYSRTMQRDAYAISQSLFELIAPSDYSTLDENPFIVREDMLSAYLALLEHITRCNIYLVDDQHDVTATFDGVVKTLRRPLLAGYLEQTIALGFMGKTPYLQSRIDGEVHVSTAMPVMNQKGRVLGVVVLESTLHDLGFAQVPGYTILGVSSLISFLVATLLAFLLSRAFTQPISALEQVALRLAKGQYETRTALSQDDEVGNLARSMDVLAQRLEEARNVDERLHKQQQVFFSNISHELKTPVTVIRGSLEALCDGVLNDSADVKAYYQQMLKESCWLQKLIQDLLELSRLQSPDYSLDLSPIHLSELLSDVAMSASALCSAKGVRFLCKEPAMDFTVTGDYSRLRQMLMAVLDNAVKFTPPGRSISLTLKGDEPVLVVHDEGEGIEAQELSQIFDRFHRQKSRRGESTGLGLAIVREIARRHEIEIDVKSAPGEGTTFRLRFQSAQSAP